MQPYSLEREQFIARPLENVFAFFSNATNLERITPPWLSFRILSPPAEMAAGTRINYEIGWHFVRLKWVSEIVTWEPNRTFTDIQIRGPYAMWHHTHSFEAKNGGTMMRDNVQYQLPLGPLGMLGHRFRVRRDLDAIFDYRATEIERLLTVQAPHHQSNGHKSLANLH